MYTMEQKTIGFIGARSSLEPKIFHLYLSSIQFSSVPQLCLTLCNPMDLSTSGFPVHHHLPVREKLMPIKSVMPSNHLILCHPFSSCPQSFPAWGSFPKTWFFASSGQSIGASASASVLPMNIQGWFPLEATGLISLKSKGHSRVFSNISKNITHEETEAQGHEGPSQEHSESSRCSLDVSSRSCSTPACCFYPRPAAMMDFGLLFVL